MSLKKNLDDVVYETICNGFADGTYVSGQKLVPAEIADKYQISKTPVIQAFKRMVSEGIIEVSNGGKYFIPEVNERQTREIYDVRLMMEIFAVKTVIQRNMDEIMVEQLKKIAEECIIFFKKEEYGKQIATDMSFHRKIVEFTQNSCLISLFDTVINKYLIANYVIKATAAPKHQLIALNEHFELIDYLRMKEEKRSIQALTDHLNNAQSRMFGNKD